MREGAGARSPTSRSWAAYADKSERVAVLAEAIAPTAGVDAGAGPRAAAAFQGRPADRAWSASFRSCRASWVATTPPRMGECGEVADAIDECLHAAFRRRCDRRRAAGARAGRGRSPRHPGRRFRGRAEAQRQQGSVRAAPQCARAGAHADRGRARLLADGDARPRLRTGRARHGRQGRREEGRRPAARLRRRSGRGRGAVRLRPRSPAQLLRRPGFHAAQFDAVAPGQGQPGGSPVSSLLDFDHRLRAIAEFSSCPRRPRSPPPTSASATSCARPRGRHARPSRPRVDRAGRAHPGRDPGVRGRQGDPGAGRARLRRRCARWPRCAPRSMPSSTASWSWPRTRTCARTASRCSPTCAAASSPSPTSACCSRRPSSSRRSAFWRCRSASHARPRTCTPPRHAGPRSRMRCAPTGALRRRPASARPGSPRRSS